MFYHRRGAEEATPDVGVAGAVTGEDPVSGDSSSGGGGVGSSSGDGAVAGSDDEEADMTGGAIDGVSASKKDD